VPVLFLVGENEVIYAISARQAVARLERVAPQIETEVFPNCGHDISIVQTERVSAWLRRRGAEPQALSTLHDERELAMMEVDLDRLRPLRISIGFLATTSWSRPSRDAQVCGVRPDRAQGAHEHEAKEHDLPLVRQGRA